MTFGQSIQTVFRKYAEFEGRASRSEFWWWVVFYVLVLSATGLFGVIRFDYGGSAGSILSGLWTIGALLPSLAVTVRRLRDADYPWGHVFWYLLPIAGLIVLAALCAQPAKTDAPGVAPAPGAEPPAPPAPPAPPTPTPPAQP
ncbi:DUF805 domain-containing protein [Agromyces sp. SYSU T00194]|uniref:DUF805 domain-containing protein n=1 Tax=Agromyces chitinivorans TaxID=3158560 RepID=UPI0033988A35